jgi:inner membrane protein
VLGRKVGRLAPIWGGICGLLPDLDILIPYLDPVKRFTYHRGASHSLLVITLLTPLIVALILKINSHTHEQRRRWYLLVFLALITHILLDCFTVYGTQIFWPLKTPPVMWSTIFIIDPLYTVPLLSGLLATLILSRKSDRWRLLNNIGIALSTLYLCWSVGAKLYVTHTVKESLARQQIASHRILTGPTPFNTVLWRVLVMEDDGYYEGFYSLLDHSREIELTRFPSENELLQGVEPHWPVERLRWFTQGFYAVRKFSDGVVISDLRMGLEPNYIFNFKVARIGNPHAVPLPSERIHSIRSFGQLHEIWNRILVRK